MNGPVENVCLFYSFHAMPKPIYGYRKDYCAAPATRFFRYPSGRPIPRCDLHVPGPDLEEITVGEYFEELTVWEVIAR